MISYNKKQKTKQNCATFRDGRARARSSFSFVSFLHFHPVGDGCRGVRGERKKEITKLGKTNENFGLRVVLSELAEKGNEKR